LPKRALSEVPESFSTWPQVPVPTPVLKERNRGSGVPQPQRLGAVVVVTVLVVVTKVLVVEPGSDELVLDVVATVEVVMVVEGTDVLVEVVPTVVEGPVLLVVVVTTVDVVDPSGHVQSSWHSRFTWPGPRGGQVRLQGGSHCSGGSTVPLPHVCGRVVLVVKVVVVTLAHGSGTQLPSPPMSMPPAAAHSLGFWGSQSNGAPATGRQQLMSCGGVSSGAHPCALASHVLAKGVTQAFPPGGAAHLPAWTIPHRMRPCRFVLQQVAMPVRPQVERAAHCIAACIPSLESPPAASAFTAWLTQRR